MEESASKAVRGVKKVMRLDSLGKRRVCDHWNKFPILGNREGANRMYNRMEREKVTENVCGFISRIFS